MTVTELLDTVVDIPPGVPPETPPTIERRGHSTMTNERSDDDSPDARPVFVDVMATFSRASFRLGTQADTDDADETGIVLVGEGRPAELGRGR